MSSPFSNSDEKYCQKNNLIEKYPFKCTNDSETILYDYIYPDENIFINEHENESYIFIEKIISWGNSEPEINQINKNEIPEQWGEYCLEKPKGINRNKFFTRYFNQEVNTITSKSEKYLHPIGNTTGSSSIITLSHPPNNTIKIQIVRNRRLLNPEKIFQHSKNSLDKINSKFSENSKFLFSKMKISNEGQTNSYDQSSQKSSIFQIISNLREKISKIQELNKPDKLIFLLDLIPFEKFIINTTRITKKCKFCGSPDHSSINCIDFKEYSSDFCVHCFGPEHKIQECPKRKCVRCNRTGHSAKFCNTEKSIEKCTSCRNIGHIKEDCLMYPDHIDTDKEICAFCNRKGHLICPINKGFLTFSDYTDSDSVCLQDDDDTESVCEIENTIKIENESKNSKIYEDQVDKIRSVCPKCSKFEENHDERNCVKTQSKRNNDDCVRSNISKSFFSMAPSKLAKDRNFLEDSFSSDDGDSLRINFVAKF